MEINSNSLFYQVSSDVSKQQAVSGITITQLDLREGTTSMGPSVSDSERHRYQAIYDKFVKSRGGEFSQNRPGQGRATLA